MRIKIIVYTAYARKPKESIVIHGHDASPNDHWYPWLGRKLQEAGHILDASLWQMQHNLILTIGRNLLALQMPDLDKIPL